MSYLRYYDTTAMVGSIMVVGVLTCCTSLQPMWDLKSTQRKQQYSLIRKPMLFKFKLNHYAMEVTENNCYTKGEGTVDYTISTRWFKKFCSSCKNVTDQEMSGWHNTMDFKAMLQTIEANLVSSTWRVSGKLSISLASVIHQLQKISVYRAADLCIIFAKFCKFFYLL